jgi:hypothetical protein
MIFENFYLLKTELNACACTPVTGASVWSTAHIPSRPPPPRPSPTLVPKWDVEEKVRSASVWEGGGGAQGVNHSDGMAGALVCPEANGIQTQCVSRNVHMYMRERERVCVHRCKALHTRDIDT